MEVVISKYVCSHFGSSCNACAPASPHREAPSPCASHHSAGAAHHPAECGAGRGGACAHDAGGIYTDR